MVVAMTLFMIRVPFRAARLMVWEKTFRIDVDPPIRTASRIAQSGRREAAAFGAARCGIMTSIRRKPLIRKHQRMRRLEGHRPLAAGGARTRTEKPLRTFPGNAAL